MVLANTGMVIGQAFQTAYVTTDMDRAIAIFKDKYGAGQYRRTGAVTIPFETGGKMTLDIALGWIGDTMIELIQPIADDVALYADWLPKQGFGLRFHHIGIRLHSAEEWAQMERENKAHGHKVVFSLTMKGTRALYIDTAADLGHYLEYLYYSDPPNSTLPHIPQNIPGHKTKY